MIKVILVLLFFALLTVWDIPELARDKQKKELIVYSVLMFIGFVLSMLVVFHISV